MTVDYILNKKWRSLDFPETKRKDINYFGACVYIIKVLEVVAYVGVTTNLYSRLSSHSDLRALLLKRPKTHKITVQYYNFKDSNNGIEKFLINHFKPPINYVPGDKFTKKSYRNCYNEVFSRAKKSSEQIIDKIIKAL